MTRVEFRNGAAEVASGARISSGTSSIAPKNGHLDGGVRAPIGYIVKMFPRLSETFILNDLLPLEREGLSLHIFSLKRPGQHEAKMAGAAVRARVTYLPERVWREPVRILWTQLRVFLSHPAGYLKALLHVLRGREFRSFGR